MKLKALALVLLLPVCAAAAEDCAKNADACAAGKKAFSPFLAAAAAEPETPKAPAPPAPAKKASLRPAAVSTAPAAVEAPAASPEAPGGRQKSSPAWVLLVLAGLAGLYYYLAGGKRRGRRK